MVGKNRHMQIKNIKIRKVKYLNLILYFLFIFSVSGCFFLEYAIPDEYQHETTLFDENGYQDELSYIWISHPVGVQCKGDFFESLEDAEFYLQKFDIETFDAFEGMTQQQKKCGYPSDLRYYVKIGVYDYEKAKALGWWETKLPDNATNR